MAKINTKLRIAILGPGAIGSFLAALFVKHGHEVICIAKKTSAEKIQKKGIKLESKFYGDFLAKPLAVEKLDSPVDILFITVKTPFIIDALKRVNLSSIKNTTIISLLNGVGYEATIRDVLGKNVVIGTIGSIQAIKNLNNIVIHLSLVKARIEIAHNSNVLKKVLKDTSFLINSIGVSASLLNSEKEVIWNKLVRLNAIASLTSAYEMNLGEIKSNFKLNELLKKIVEEGALVANKEGVFINPIQIMRQIDELPFSLETSMQRDIVLGQKSEFESITFGVLNLARVYGISAPAHELIYNIIERKITNFENQINGSN